MSTCSGRCRHKWCNFLALTSLAGLFVVWRAITASKDVSHAADEFLEQLDREEIDQFRIMTDF